MSAPSSLQERRFRSLDRGRSPFAGTDPDDVFDGGDEYFSVADLTALRRLADCFDNGIGGLIVNHHLDFHLRQKVDGVFRPTIKFGVAFLASEAFDFEYGQTLDADIVEGIFDIAQFV